jgi:predicted regulator of Ras-like GTPase activity (Roadblock/LC7/MglB family)
MDPQLTSLIVSERETRLIEDCLERLVDDTGANYSMLLDKSGQVVAAQGDTARQDITALGALLAGTFASSREVARLLKEKDFRVLFQQGIKENIFTELIGEQWMLVVMFDKRTHIGLVKVLAKRATDELTSILDTVRQQSRAKDAVISSSFRTSMEDTIDLLFKD